MKMKQIALATILFLLCVTWAYSGSSDNLSSTDSNKVSVKALPFAAYHNSLGWVLGGFAGITGIAQERTQLKVGGLVSSNGSYYGYLQVEEWQLPFFQRIYCRPDIYIGKIGEVKYYPDKSNGSVESSNIKMKGNDTWMECNFKYLLPIGDGADNVISHPKFDKGILISGAAGGTEYNPLKSGRTFVGTKLIYRELNLHNDGLKLTKNQISAAMEFALSYENMDYYFNPTRGSFQKISYTKDWGTFGSNSPSDVVKMDLRWYIPLYDKDAGDLPRVLAINVLSADTPSWYDYDETIAGKPRYFRPPYFCGANLGGVKYLRAYKDFRFFDKASIYYSAEIRQNLPWNPLNDWSLTRKIGVDFLQLALFADLGRVAPEWRFSTLHTDMKYSLGGGLRMFMDGMVVRLDVAGGDEGFKTQMFLDQPF